MKTLLSRKISIVFLVIQLLVSAALIGIAFYVDLFSTKYIVALIGICVFSLPMRSSAR